MRALEIIPLLIVPAGIYNVVALGGSATRGADVFATEIEGPLLTLALPSNGIWTVSGGDVLVMLALALLFFELLRSTGSGRFAIINHSLSLILFLVCAAQFLLLPAFATTTFFLVTLMAFLDVLAGTIVSIVTARRDVSWSDGHD
jgi:hypothetical protein